jgi:hypothetical protein
MHKTREDRIPAGPGKPRRLVPVSLVLLAVLTLPGCLLDRLLTVKAQMCAFDDYFVVSLEGGVDIRMSEPVLLRSDVVQIFDAPPTLQLNTAGGSIDRWVFARQGDSQGAEFSFDFEYRQFDEQQLLSRISMGPLPATSLSISSEELSALARERCQTPLNPFTRSIETVIDPAWLDPLPTRTDIIREYGAPSAWLAGEDALVYEYRLQGSEDPAHVVHITAWFESDKPVRVETTFAEYHAQADLVSGIARTTFR